MAHLVLVLESQCHSGRRNGSGQNDSVHCVFKPYFFAGKLQRTLLDHCATLDSGPLEEDDWGVDQFERGVLLRRRRAGGQDDLQVLRVVLHWYFYKGNCDASRGDLQVLNYCHFLRGVPSGCADHPDERALLVYHHRRGSSVEESECQSLGFLEETALQAHFTADRHSNPKQHWGTLDLAQLHWTHPVPVLECV